MRDLFNKTTSFVLMAVFAFALSLTFFVTPSQKAEAGVGGGTGQPFSKVIYVKSGGASTNGGDSYDAAKGCAADGDLWDIPAGTLITKVYVKMETAVTGSSALDIGDDDDPNGFFDGGTSGMEGASFAANV